MRAAIKPEFVLPPPMKPAAPVAPVPAVGSEHNNPMCAALRQHRVAGIDLPADCR
jgi:hypothetical protein